MSRSAETPPEADDLDAVRSFTRNLKIACDELHDDPFNPEARAVLMRLVEHDALGADAALARVEREHGHAFNPWSHASGQ